MRRASTYGMALRITVHENGESMVLKLEGRLTGPWVAELNHLWQQTSATRGGRKIALDLRETTYADASGIKALRSIYRETEAAILSGTPWTQYLADEVTRKEENEEV
jgi:anti-anti-sigma regulatory factor